MQNEKILVTGAGGQLGSVLVEALKNKFGEEAVIASDLNPIKNYKGIYEQLDVTNKNCLEYIVKKYKVTQIYHLAAILSAKGEQNPLQTWDINMKTLFNVLEVSVAEKISKVFYPSSIAVYGDMAPKMYTAQSDFLNPSTVYGISKAAGENWAQYYFLRYGLDVRSLRYPGVIGYQSLPGGGTTDYAVEIYHKAIKEEDFECYLKADAMLPMIYMDDTIRATLELMDAPKESISVRTSYNLHGMSFTPEQITASIQKYYPNFKVTYNPDFRQNIAENWPSSINDEQARQDWGWEPKYDLDAMTQDMLKHLKEQYILVTQ
ncbi:NAD-dependent epimerase/dehydratase family protein [Aestuariibaculum lutulentum]|uniref:NAD-dependent epimerase/dehydratase family protein n=1 Tax=Aestuariibaculum lutulentum TaxID=2920935 RepID=A0ABS9RHV7_9FLAO|nr:NAD-dependent epimerase/dehydratase family protein [Aestuariibaculum lutulentum]MCH4552535.1 NAD-dependent epimerase/dehydratase family protein [Aestuariibaculum lutulentum]